MTLLAYRLSILLWSIAVCPQLLAQPRLFTAYQQGADFAKSHQQQAIAASQNAHPDVVPGYSTDKYLPAYSATDLKQAAQSQAATDSTAALIKKSFNQQITLQPAISADMLERVKQSSGERVGFCRDGACSNPHYTPSPDFEQALSSLSAAAYASKDDMQGFIFSGYRQSCRVDGFSYNDCCRDKGWGQDLHLAGCSLGEQRLGLAKQAGSCHATGTYCDKRVLGVCVRHKQSYCCFNSKLGRVIQEQGRQQLGWGWGRSKRPNCQGLQTEQLQQLDFSRMDLSEFYDDLHRRMHQPDVQAEQTRIKNRLEYNPSK